jgi:hypothetical protein
MGILAAFQLSSLRDNLTHMEIYIIMRARGAVAQLGERMNGIHEARGSIPLSSTNSSIKTCTHIALQMFAFK